MKVILQSKPRENKELAKALSKKVGLSNTITEYMCDKGYKTKEDILRFINFNEGDLRKVLEMKDGENFLETLANAVTNGKKVVIYGDYDGDGVCATTIFMRTLTNLAYKLGGKNPDWFISNRFKEGYGLSVKGMERLISTYPDVELIVTCDNGIVAFDGVNYAKSKGIDVIISDHHAASPDGRLPDCPVVCEKRLDENRDIQEDFCGAELARRLCTELIYKLGKDEEMREFTNSLYAFAGFATITDVIEFNAANHYVTKRGLEMINSNKLECFNAMKEVMGITKNIDEILIGYKLGPMINAAGRILGEATIPTLLFLSRKKENCLNYANKLLELNTIRQEKSLEEQKQVKTEIEGNGYENDPFIVVSEGDYEEGIAGLNASFIVDNYKVPAICLCKTEDSEIYKGSARSVEGFNIKAALDKCADLLLGYGGHPGAAGLSIKKENIIPFRNRMIELARDVEKLEEIINIDYILEPKEVDIELAEQYKNVLAPFGPKFERPLFALNCKFEPNPTIMKEKHIKTDASGRGFRVTLLWFNSIFKYQKKEPDGKNVLVIGQPSENEYRGVKLPQFIADEVYLPNQEDNVTTKIRL